MIEYIRALRPHIRTIHSNGQVYRQIDHSAFWQDQHDGLKAVLEKERDATFVLKQQNDALESQVTQLLARSKPGRKRKVEQEEPEKVKKLKAGTIAITEFGLAADIDPGKCFYDGRENSANFTQSSKLCDTYIGCKPCAEAACGAQIPMSWPTTSFRLCKPWRISSILSQTRSTVQILASRQSPRSQGLVSLYFMVSREWNL